MQSSDEYDYRIAVLCISLMIYNFLVFLFFGYNYIKKKTQKMIVQITMLVLIIRNFRLKI